MRYVYVVHTRPIPEYVMWFMEYLKNIIKFFWFFRKFKNTMQNVFQSKTISKESSYDQQRGPEKVVNFIEPVPKTVMIHGRFLLLDMLQ